MTTSVPVDAMLSLIPDAALVVDRDGTITGTNDAADVLFGYDTGELVGQSVDVLVPTGIRDAHARHREAFLRQPRTRTMGSGLELYGRRRDGTEVAVDISLAPLPDSDQDAVVAAIRDVTERREAEAQLRLNRELLLIGDERERIARELHDLVIQRLFATGLTLQSVLPLVGDERAVERLGSVVDELDETIREIRTTIFTLAPTPLALGGLRIEVYDVVAAASRALGFEPSLRFDGPIDAVVDGVTSPHVLAVMREALSNVARHAHAQHATVALTTDGVELSVVVEDDGVGIGEMPNPSGLRNLRQRAEELGGSFSVGPAKDKGTRLEWRVPVRSSR